MGEKEIKVGMFGGGGVGKTAITLQFLKGEFTEGYIPTIEDQFSKVIDVDGQEISLIIIDTAGQDDFAEMRFSYYNQVQGFVLVFDITNPSSVDDLKKMYKDISESVDDVRCVVAANKADMRAVDKDQVPQEKYKEIENEMKCKVLETSAKTGSNIQELYTEVIREILSNKSSKPTTEKKESKKKDNSGGSGGCCEIA